MSKRAEHRETTERAILAAGLRLLAVGGAQALTVRGLARELGLVPSALYRYVADREDLLTLLIAHAHRELADAVLAAHERVDPGDLRGRWRAIAHANRTWSRAHTQEFALIFGTPVPGYHAPPERTTEPGTRVHLLLARLGADAEAAGVLPTPTPDAVLAAAGLGPTLQFLHQAGIDVAGTTVHAGLAAWQLMMGALFSELFGHLGGDWGDPDAHFAGIVAAGEQLIFGAQTS